MAFFDQHVAPITHCALGKTVVTGKKEQQHMGALRIEHTICLSMHIVYITAFFSYSFPLEAPNHPA
jgi:hypothetical protein